MDKKSLLNKLVGFGDLKKAKIFFFGYEEKEISGEDNDQLRLEFYNKKAKEGFFWFTNEELYDEYPALKENDKKAANSNKTYGRYRSLYNILIGNNALKKNSEIGSCDIPLFVGNIYPFPAEQHDTNTKLFDERKEILKIFFECLKSKSEIKVFFFVLSEVKNCKEDLRGMLGTFGFEFKSCISDKSLFCKSTNGKNHYYIFYHPTSSKLSNKLFKDVVSN